MLQRTLALFAFGTAAVLLVTGPSDAQPPGKGGFDKSKFGKGPNPEVQKLEAELSKLSEQVKALQEKIDSVKKGGIEAKGFGKGFGKDFPKDFGKGKGPDMKKDDAKKETAKPGFPGFGRGGFAKMDPATIKEKYEFYKKLYTENKFEPKGKSKSDFGKGRGYDPRGRESTSAEARIDRLIRELEELRSEVRSDKKKRS